VPHSGLFDEKKCSQIEALSELPPEPPKSSDEGFLGPPADASAMSATGPRTVWWGFPKIKG